MAMLRADTVSASNPRIEHGKMPTSYLPRRKIYLAVAVGQRKGVWQTNPAYAYVCTKLFADKKLRSDWDKVIRRAPASMRVLTSARLLDAVFVRYACRQPPPVEALAEIESRYATLDEAARLLQKAFPGPPKVTVGDPYEAEAEHYEEGGEDEAPDDVAAELRATLDAVSAQSDAGSGSAPPASPLHRYYWEKWTLIPDALRAARKHLELEFDREVTSKRRSDQLFGRKRTEAERRVFCLNLAADFENLLDRPHLDLVISIYTRLFPGKIYSLAAIKAARRQHRNRE